MRLFLFLRNLYNRSMRKIIILIAILIVIAIILTVAVGTYFVNFAVHRKDTFNMNLLPEEERNSASSESERQRVIRENREAFASSDEVFLSSADKEDVSIVSSDGLSLKASFYRNEGSRYVILVHGYMSSRKDMLHLAGVYSSWGYNVLSPDNRAHGESDGTWIGMGWLDKDDIKLWIDWIIDRDPEAEIVLHGISMGAATVMMVSGLDLPDNVKAAVEDCGYTSVWDIFADELKALFHLPPFPVMNMYSVMSRIITGYTPKEASSLDMLSESEIPMLFIHGDDDHFVGTYMLDICFDAKRNGDKEKLLVPDAGHGEAYLREPELYFDTVHEFISRYVE